MFIEPEDQAYPCPASHIYRRETLGDKPRVRAIQVAARSNLLDAVGKYQAIEDMHDDAVAEIRRYRSPRECLTLTERDRHLRLARSVRKLAAAHDGIPAAIKAMAEASADLITIETEIDDLRGVA